MMFVALWLMRFVGYDVCRFMMFFWYEYMMFVLIWRLSLTTFVALWRLAPIMTFVACRVCRSIIPSSLSNICTVHIVLVLSPIILTFIVLYLPVPILPSISSPIPLYPFSPILIISACPIYLFIFLCISFSPILTFSSCLPGISSSLSLLSIHISIYPFLLCSFWTIFFCKVKSGETCL